MGRRTLPFSSLVALLFALIVPLGCRQSTTATAGQPVVRVRLLDNVQQVSVTANGQVIAKSSADDQSRKLNFPGNTAVPIALGSEGWHVGNVLIAGGTSELKFTPSADGAIKVNGKAYRGEYRFVPGANNKFDVVNDVPIDSYLKGVLPGELPARWN